MSKAQLKLAAAGLVLFPFAASLFGLAPTALPLFFVAAVDYLSLPGLLAAFLVPPIAFYVWASFHKPGAPVSIAAIVVLAVVAVASWFYLAHASLESNEMWPVQYFETMNIIFAVVLTTIAAASWRYRNVRLVLLFEWLFVGWLISFAFPYLGEMP